MSEKLKNIKIGYTNLDSSEKVDFKKFIEEFDKKTTTEQRTFSETLKESFNKSLGPKMSTGCPCCGK